MRTQDAPQHLKSLILDKHDVRAVMSGAKMQIRLPLSGEMPKAPAHENVNPRHMAKHDAVYFDSYCSERKNASNPRGMSRRWCWWTRDDRQCLPTLNVGVKPGDLLWIRERAAVTYRSWHHRDGDRFAIDYAADTEGSHYVGHMYRTCGTEIRVGKPDKVFPQHSHTKRGKVRYGSPTNMPRWASRLTLNIKSVRVERLSAATTADLIAEATEDTSDDRWDRLHPRKAAADDPWTLVIRFETLRENIDRLAALCSAA